MKRHVLFVLLALLAATTQAQNVPSAKAETHKLKISYLFKEDLSQAADPYVEELAEGEAYSVRSPQIEGFTPDYEVVEGVMGDQDIEETVLYMKDIITFHVITQSDPEAGGTTSGDGDYDAETEATVTAEANEGYNFVRWTKDGETVSEEAEYTFQVTEDCTLTAHFAIALSTTYTITVSASPSEGGSVSGGGSYEEGASCTVNAVANADFTFVNWTENGEAVSVEADYTFTVSSDRTLVAHFVQQGAPTHTVTVNPFLSHGNLIVEPSGEVTVGETVRITAVPDENYVLDVLKAYNKDDVNQEVEIIESAFEMPDFDVMVTATFEPTQTPPTIDDDIEAPHAICSGGVLELTAPHVTNADNQGWQMASSETFTLVVNYDGQALDDTYDGWYLRYMASNSTGTVYSNVVTITVREMGALTLTGDASSCTGLECTYVVANAGNATLTWSLSDETAIMTPSGNTLVVLWGSNGTQRVSVLAEDTETGCTANLDMNVNVQSYINEADVNDIVVKKHDGVPYLLIYPNPKDTYKYQWYRNGEAIEGATGQYYYPAAGLPEGNYQVYISFNADAQGHLFCGAFSAACTVASSALSYAVYPNPAHSGEQLYFTNDGDNVVEVEVYSIDGKLLHRQTIAGGRQTLGVTLSQGIYMMRINDGADVNVEKIVIQ